MKHPNKSQTNRYNFIYYSSKLADWHGNTYKIPLCAIVNSLCSSVTVWGGRTQHSGGKFPAKFAVQYACVWNVHSKTDVMESGQGVRAFSPWSRSQAPTLPCSGASCNPAAVFSVNLSKQQVNFFPQAVWVRNLIGYIFEPVLWFCTPCMRNAYMGWTCV